MITLLIDNFDLTGQEESFLTANADAAAVTLTVKNSDLFVLNNYALVEKDGLENAELKLIGATPTATTITVAALSLDHKTDAVVTNAPYNQITVYRASSKAGIYAALDTVDMQYDEAHTLYNDSTGTASSWYKVIYVNDATSATTALADAIAVRGGVNLIADPASFYANTYVNYEMAADYFNNRITSEAWFNASTYEQGQALIEAVNRIDAMRYKGQKVWYKQKLQFPRFPNSRSVSGTPQSGSTTTLVDSNLANLDLYQDQEWEFAGLRIIDGTNEKETRLIETFDVDTGTLTVHNESDDFSSAIDTTSQYQLIEKVQDDIRDAQCELALWIIKEQAARNTSVDPNVKSEKTGDYSVTYRDTNVERQMPAITENLLKKYISRTGRMINSRTIV